MDLLGLGAAGKLALATLPKKAPVDLGVGAAGEIPLAAVQRPGLSAGQMLTRHFAP